MGTLTDIFKSTLNDHSDNTALIFGDNKLSYALLYEASQRLANGLLKLDIKRGDRVAIMLPNVPHFCISYLGIIAAGAVVVPVNIMYNSEEIAFILNDCGASVLITWSGFQAQAIPAAQSCESCKHTLVLGENIVKGTIALTQLISDSAPLETPEEIRDDEIAVINYTSGIADHPLGAELSHNALFSNATTCVDMFRITSEDKQIAVLPLFHPLGQTLIMNASLIAGASVVLMPRYSPEEIVEMIDKFQVTFMAAVPGIFTNLNSLDTDTTLPSLKYCMSYGGKLLPEVLDAFEEKYKAFILQSYGLTEAGPLVTSTRFDHERKTGSVGLPIVGVEVQIRNEEGGQLLPFQSGEIWVKSPANMLGYYGNERETSKKLVNEWLFTGDIGYIDDDYYLYIQERKENIIIKGGFQILPQEVEKVLLQHNGIAEAAVVGVPDPVQGSEVKAFIVVRDGKNFSHEELITFCRESLPVYKTPRYVEIVSGLPKSPTGRVLKRLLKNNPQNRVNN